MRPCFPRSPVEGSVGVRVDTGARSPHYGDTQRRHQEWLARKAQQLSLRLETTANQSSSASNPYTSRLEEGRTDDTAAGEDGGSTKPFSPSEEKVETTARKRGDGHGTEVGRTTLDEDVGGQSSLRGAAAAEAAAVRSKVDERIYRLKTGAQLWRETYVPPIEPARRRELIDKWTGTTWPPPEDALREVCVRMCAVCAHACAMVGCMAGVWCETPMR